MQKLLGKPIKMDLWQQKEGGLNLESEWKKNVNKLTTDKIH